MLFSTKVAKASVVALAAHVAAQGISADELSDAARVKNVAVIGAGPAGSSAAYHLSKYAADASLPINITIFESTDHIGGRTLTVPAWGLDTHPVELGASIFVSANYIMVNATRDFGLSTDDPQDSDPDDVTAIWDGESFVFEEREGSPWWYDRVKMVARYGLSPYYAMKMMERTVAKFVRLYEEPVFPWRSLTQRVFELGLSDITAVTGEQLLAANKISTKFSRHLIQAATRVNYASNLAYIHGLATMVSIATEGAMSVFGGNWRIFDGMVQRSGATVYRNTSVASISLVQKENPEANPRYTVTTKTASSSEAVQNHVEFDSIVIAAPWQYADIKADRDVIRHTIDEIPYTKLHVLLFTSPFTLRPGFFGLEDGAHAPSRVYSTLKEGEVPKSGAEGVGPLGFYSISKLRTMVNPKTQRREILYKIFSAEKVTSAFLTDLLGARIPDTITSSDAQTPNAETVDPISWHHYRAFHSYPLELPRVTFQDPVVGDSVYYTSGMESLVSCMECSALVGMNVARLVADDLASPQEEEQEEMKPGIGREPTQLEL